MVVNFCGAHNLACEDLTEVDLALSDAYSSAVCDADCSVMEGVVRLRRRLVDAHGRCIEIARIGTTQRLVWTLVVVNIDEPVKAFLLLQKVERSRFGGLLLQCQMHAFVTAVLLWIVPLPGRQAKRRR